MDKMIINTVEFPDDTDLYISKKDLLLFLFKTKDSIISNERGMGIKSGLSYVIEKIESLKGE